MDNCRFCSKPLKDLALALPATPLANAFLTKEQLDKPEAKWPLDIYVCHNCLLVQLPAYERADAIFNDQYAYFSSFSTEWLKHAAKYVDDVTPRFGLTSASLVVEVASNDGYLLQNFVKKNIPVLGIEPSGNTAAEAEKKGVRTVVEFFGRETAKNLVKKGMSADLMIANNTMAHVPDINDFIGGFKVLLKPRGVITFESPDLRKLVEFTQFDTIYHEHFSYYTLSTARRILAGHGLNVFDVQELTTHGGSLRLFVCHEDDSSRSVSENVKRILDIEERGGYEKPETYHRLTTDVARVKKEFLAFLTNAKAEGKKIAAYGAPAKGNTFLNTVGVTAPQIAFTVDRNPFKQDRYLPGSHIPISSPERIAKEKPDYIVILPWNLKDEIAEQLEDARDWGAKFVTAIPKLEIF